MKFVERQLRTREVFSRPFDEGWRHVAAHPLDVFTSAAVLLEECLESAQSARVLALRGEDNLRRIQIHEDRYIIVPSLAGGLVESDIIDIAVAVIIASFLFFPDILSVLYLVDVSMA